MADSHARSPPPQPSSERGVSARALRWALGPLSLWSTLGLSCQAEPEPHERPLERASQALSSAGGRALARVGERVITERDLNRRLTRLPAVTRRSYEPPERRRELLESMIRTELLARRGEAHGLLSHPSVRVAYAQALRAATLAQQAHVQERHGVASAKLGEAKPEDKSLTPPLRLLFLAPELEALQGATPQPSAEPLHSAPPPRDEEQP